jgi:hypothetical protein
MEMNGSYFPKDISQSSMLFELMHGLGESIVIHLNGKYEHNEKSKFSLFLFPSEKIMLLPQFSIDIAHLMYNAHPKLFRLSF